MVVQYMVSLCSGCNMNDDVESVVWCAVDIKERHPSIHLQCHTEMVWQQQAHWPHSSLTKHHCCVSNQSSTDPLVPHHLYSTPLLCVCVCVFVTRASNKPTDPVIRECWYVSNKSTDPTLIEHHCYVSNKHTDPFLTEHQCHVSNKHTSYPHRAPLSC